MEYNKPFKSIQEQIQLLRDRGLIIDDDAEHYLRHLNYYRLSGYWLSLQDGQAKHQFTKNTHFDDVLNLYVFDRELRLLLLDAIERVEVSARTHWAYYCAETYGAHAYLENTYSKNTNWHQKNLDLLNNEIDRSNELFIKHYQLKYSAPSLPPIWAVCEVMSLGLLSRWLKDLKSSEIRRKIANCYQLNYSVLASFIEHIAHIRNICAHHNRLWNRMFTKTMQIPRSKPIQIIDSFNRDTFQSRKIYNTLTMLIHLLTIICPKNHFKDRLLKLIDSHSISVSHMGFPIEWQKNHLWDM